MNLSNQPYNTIAGWYDLLDYYWEKRRYQHIRPVVWAQATGHHLLDAGVGTGRNIPYYPHRATVTAIDLSTQMIFRAKQRAHLLGRPLHALPMDLSRLDFKDHTFDSIVSTFVLYVMPPTAEQAAIKEMARILKPNGKLILLDYTYSRHALRRGIQRLFAPLVFLLYGARLDNTTLEEVQKRFIIEKVQYLHADTLRLIVARKDVKSKKNRAWST